MSTNTAAWINARHDQLQVGPAPYTPPGDDQIVVRTQAVAINPLDWIIQVAGNLAYRWLTYPTVLGSDVAGEVVEVGKAVTGFAEGDRVLGHAVGSDKDANCAAEGAFQHYTVLLERLASPIPDEVRFEDAAVLPLAVSTAACGLFQKDHLGLQHPTAAASPTGETVLVWGGSTSVGSNSIQLAVAAGYEVVTTASPRNVDYVMSLGASQVIDYNSPAVVADVIAGFERSYARRCDRHRHHIGGVVRADRELVQGQEVCVHRHPTGLLRIARRRQPQSVCRPDARPAARHLERGFAAPIPLS